MNVRQLGETDSIIYTSKDEETEPFLVPRVLALSIRSPHRHYQALQDLYPPTICLGFIVRISHFIKEPILLLPCPYS